MIVADAGNDPTSNRSNARFRLALAGSGPTHRVALSPKFHIGVRFVMEVSTPFTGSGCNTRTWGVEPARVWGGPLDPVTGASGGAPSKRRAQSPITTRMAGAGGPRPSRKAATSLRVRGGDR